MGQATGAGRHGAGALIAGAGGVGLLWCVRNFSIHGRGTLAPRRRRD